MERDVAGCCGEVTVIVTAAVALTSLITLVARGLLQGLCLLLRLPVKDFFYTSSTYLLGVHLVNFLI